MNKKIFLTSVLSISAISPVIISAGCKKTVENNTGLTFKYDDQTKTYFVSGVNRIKFDEKNPVVISELVIPSVWDGKAVAAISSEVFYGLNTLTKVTIPSSIQTIGTAAFKDAKNLKEIIFEEGSKLSNIGEAAFQGCTSLEKITMPESLQYIGNNAFKDCNGAKFELTITGENKLFIGSNVFQNVSDSFKIIFSKINEDKINEGSSSIVNWKQGLTPNQIEFKN
ncbi:leucine-rich repeat domain-containing protein [Mycoplasmopsis felifaucium]|uniref:Leucine-rich repeat domain-containing protein n=1 Tax=Mycoplasmopsis felifaucium TaxID=35768 RepID=A0ABZ2RQC6_9BACT